MDVVTLSFSGCTTASCTTPDITGTYTFDPDAGSIGDWSFTTPFGAFPGSCSGMPSSFCTNTSNPNYAGTFQLLDFVNGNLGLQLAFNGANGFDGSLITTALTSNGSADPSMLANLSSGDILYLLSGSSSVVAVATPEPSSIAMLGLGLLGLFILRRRRSLHRLRLAQS